jgi:hypothetical protein
VSGIAEKAKAFGSTTDATIIVGFEPRCSTNGNCSVHRASGIAEKAKAG